MLESKWLDSKLLQSGLMREERRPATGRNVGDLESLRHKENGNFSSTACLKEDASACSSHCQLATHDLSDWQMRK